VDGENFWLWNFVNRQVALFRIEEKRASKVVKDTLGEEYEGILSSDFYSAYNDNIKAKGKQIIENGDVIIFYLYREQAQILTLL